MNSRTIFLSSLVSIAVAIQFFGRPAGAQEFTRSTIPLKSGGSMTSIKSQGRSVAYVNQDNGLRTADARNVDRRIGGNTNQRRETGFNPAFAQASDSFYRQAQSDEDQKYPYPESANFPQRRGFESQSIPGNVGRDSGQSDLRFERSGIGQRPSGALGSNDAATNNTGGNRVAQLPQPPNPLPGGLPPQGTGSFPQNPTGFTQSGSGSGTRLPSINPNCNCGPNYANPAANYAVGYQGFQPAPQAANSVPALNIQMPPLNPAVNPNCCSPQSQGGFLGNPGYQFQPGIGTPQLRGNSPWWSSFLTGSGQYTPLIQFRNMPPGTYLGQGLIGQPTAYVDGQPIRNLLRYVSP
jgi:hypothetical protein